MKKALLYSFLLLISSIVTNAQAIADFTFNDVVNNTPHNLFDYLGEDKVVVLKFFSTTCGACNAFAPKYQALYEENGSNQDGVVVLLLDIANTETNPEVLNWVNDRGIEIPTLNATNIGSYWNNNISQYTPNTFTPQIVVIKPNLENLAESEVVYGNGGSISDSELQDIKDAIESSKTNSNIEVVNTIHVQLFPNPADNFLRIKFVDNYKNLNISLFDLNGKLLKQEQAVGTTQTIDIGDFPIGSYFIQVSDDTQVLYRETFQKK